PGLLTGGGPVAAPEETADKGAPAVVVRPPSAVVPAWTAFDRRLRAATPLVPVTAGLVALNVLVFTALAVAHGRLLEFNGHTLLRWGAVYAPRTFGGQWWRLGSSLFLHGGLLHLSANLLFLLLAAPLVERLLGPVRFAVVYL